MQLEEKSRGKGDLIKMEEIRDKLLEKANLRLELGDDCAVLIWGEFHL